MFQYGPKKRKMSFSAESNVMKLTPMTRLLNVDSAEKPFWCQEEPPSKDSAHDQNVAYTAF
jgi:hypothetical protein